MAHRLPTARLRALAILSGLTALLTASPAAAATGTIDHVEAQGTALQLVLSLDDLPEGTEPDLGSVAAAFEGTRVDSTAQPLAEVDELGRTTVLAIDVSNSMAGFKFEGAKSAARAFLDEVPDSVAVGIVTFAGEVTVAQEPTQDHAAVSAVIDTLTLSRGTRLYDGLSEAVQLSGDAGSRSVLVLSDGADTSATPIEDAVGAVEGEDVVVDVVALAQSPDATAALDRLAEAGGGQVLSAEDPAALSQIFAEQARALAQQVLVTIDPGPGLAGQEGSMEVSLDVAGTTVTDSAFVTLPGSPGGTEPAATGSGALRSLDLGPQVPRPLMYGGLALASLAIAAMVVIALGGGRSTREDAIDRSIDFFTRTGSRRQSEAAAGPSYSVTGQAVAVADSVLATRKGLEGALSTRLEGGGLSMRPAEWMLMHIGIAVGGGLLGLFLGGGLMMFLGLLLGLVGPMAYLVVRRARRLSRFKSQLADTMQLMAGSLSAGLSLAQSLDTVVAEGADPIAAEFRRALVETRLGVEIEEALSGISDRMESVDFEWVVMAIRIQREVGGNLAELLGTVSETIREREYLERQVKSLSAEGRLSVWILGGLPPAFLAYLFLANPTYVAPLFRNALGWVMVGVMVTLEVVGILWMKRLVRVEI